MREIIDIIYIRIRQFFAFIGFAVVILIAVFLLKLDYFGRAVADRLLANAAIPTRGEMPVTSGQVPFSSADIQIVGGRGEGLSCSLPPDISKLAFPIAAGRSEIGLEMRQACAMHDFCYRHGAATYGYTQADCDFTLQEQAFQLCYFIERARDEGRINDNRSKCIRDARLVTLGVRIGGSDSFRSVSQNVEALSAGLDDEIGVDGRASTYFEYDPYPIRSQSYTAYRIADAPNSDGKLGQRKRVYEFSVRPSGVFVSVAPNSAQLWQKSILPGNPAYIVGAPIVAEARHNGQTEDWFVWWQRRSLGETGGRLIGIAPGRATTVDWRCLYFSGMSGSMRDASTSCRSADMAFFAAELGNGRNSGDAYFSEILPSHLGRITDDILWLSALQTHNCRRDGSNGLCFLDMAVSITSGESMQPQWPIRVFDEISPIYLGKPQYEDTPYRNFVSHPQILNPSSKNDPTLVWSRRDERFESISLVRRLGIRRHKDRPEYSAAVPRGSMVLDDDYETDDPSFVIGRNSKSPLMVGFQRVGGSENPDQLRLAEWHVPVMENKAERSRLAEIPVDFSKCSVHLDKTWLARPPIVSSISEENSAVILSRANSIRKGDAPRTLEIGLLIIATDGSCSDFKSLAGIPLDHFILAGSPENQNEQRVEILRKTPILAGDLDGDGQIEILFPAVGGSNNTIDLARISHDFRLLSLL
ncbi:hypothetical protein [Mesorhizobium sp. B263B2A]|uniref:hypothetical protein n=1 Tax=Mesorhizobium sp. B263B2A TaxID=2876669 RepID=UPI001CD15531|nr:hypothetical protein [Mesorhizobium sp. B263B2A]MCA0033912.1 hypothetical protein [Mesorhizobium sp. B263B2A]